MLGVYLDQRELEKQLEKSFFLPKSLEYRAVR